MPHGNRVHHNGGAGRKEAGVRGGQSRAGEQMAEGAAQISERLGEGYGMVRDEAGRQYRRMEGMIARTPTSSVLIGFGLGFGLGLVLTTMLNRPEESWAERHLPEGLRRASDSLGRLAESLRSMPETMAQHVPAALRRG